MKELLTPYIIALLGGALIGIVVEILLDHSKEPEKQNKLKKLILSACIGIVVSEVLFISLHIGPIIPRIEMHLQRDNYNKAVNNILQIQNDDINNLFRKGLDFIDDKLIDLCNGELYIDRKDIFDFWEGGFKLSKRKIEATNYVSVEDWNFFSEGGDGRAIQEETLNRGVEITRLFIYVEDDINQISDQIKLADAHEKIRGKSNNKKIEIGWVNVDNILKRDFSQRYVEKLHDNFDIVLFDRKLLLITKVNDKDRKMEYSILTVKCTPIFGQ